MKASAREPESGLLQKIQLVYCNRAYLATNSTCCSARVFNVTSLSRLNFPMCRASSRRCGIVRFLILSSFLLCPAALFDGMPRGFMAADAPFTGGIRRSVRADKWLPWSVLATCRRPAWAIQFRPLGKARVARCQPVQESKSFHRKHPHSRDIRA